MTAKEFFKKLETYNEVSAMVGNKSCKIALLWDEDKKEEFSTFSEFSKFVKETFIKEVARKILKCTEFKNHEETTIEYISLITGSTTYRKCELYIVNNI